MRRGPLLCASTLAAAVAACAASGGNGAWHEARGPEGGHVTALAVGPASSTIYAGTEEGRVFKTVDAGAHWRALDLGTRAYRITSVIADPRAATVVYAGTRIGVFKSSDAGAKWRPASGGLPEPELARDIGAMAIDPTNPATLYVGADGVYKTSDGGDHWLAKNAGLTQRIISALAVDPRNPATVYAGTPDEGVFKSTDGADHWASASRGLTADALDVTAIAVDPRNPSIVFVGTDGGGLDRSTNGGTTWARVSARFGAANVGALLFAGETVYAATGDGLFKSADDGSTWQSAGRGLPSVSFESNDALAANAGNPTTLYAGTFEHGVYRSSDAAGSWLPANGELAATIVDAVATARAGEVYASNSTSAVSQSADAGATWRTVNTGLPRIRLVDGLAVDPTRPTTIYGATESGVFKTTDGGGHWRRVLNRQYFSFFAVAVDARHARTVYVGSERGIFKSTNGGGVWRAMNSGLHVRDIHTIAVDPRHPNVVYAGSKVGDGVFKTTNSGRSWHAMNVGVARPKSIRRLAIDPNHPSIVYAATANGVFKTTTGARRWRDAGLRAGTECVVLDPDDPNTVYAGGSGVYVSRDAGAHWLPLDGPPNWLEVTALAFDGRTLYVGTFGAGVATYIP